MHRCLYICFRTYAFTFKFGNFSPKKKKARSLTPYTIQMCGNALTYRFAVIVTVMCLYLYTYVCRCGLWIHFHFATNERRIYVLWICFDPNSKYTKHLFTFIFFLHLPILKKKQSQKPKESKEFLYLSSSTSVKFQHIMESDGNLIDFSITCKCVCVCEYMAKKLCNLSKPSAAASAHEKQQQQQQPASK